jgi:hypothetical protein
MICKGSIKLGHLNFGPNVKVVDSNLRSFCFKLYDKSGSDCLYFSCESLATKELWKSKITDILRAKTGLPVKRVIAKTAGSHVSFQHQLQLLHDRKANNPDASSLESSLDSDMESIVSENLFRPKLFLKVCRARGLLDRDANGSVDCLVKVTVGNTTVRTGIHRGSLNPVWGIIFPFVWTFRDRYARVEVFSEDATHSFGLI